MVPLAIAKAFVQGVGDPLIALAADPQARIRKAATELQGMLSDEPPSIHGSVTSWRITAGRAPRVIRLPIVAPSHSGRHHDSS